MCIYAKMKEDMARGWNTWNSPSVLCHVLLPEAFTLNLGLKEYSAGYHLQNALIAEKGKREETVLPGT